MASQKQKTFYVEQTPFSIRFARVVPNGEGSVIEEVRAMSTAAPEEIKGFVQEFAQPKIGQLTRAVCAIYPLRRLVRHASLKDALRPNDSRALETFIAGQFKIDPSEYMLAALNADDGTPFDGTRPNRDVLFCGAPRSAFQEAQTQLLEFGIYPQRLEMGSIGTAGFFLQTLRQMTLEEPVLLLEIDADSSNMIVFNKGRVDSARPLSLGLNSMVAGVREELDLKDEAAARRLFFSDSFDFRGMGPRLVERIVRELQSMIGFYEVQTGQSLSRMICTLLPPKLNWLNQTFASSLGMKVLEVDVPQVLAKAGLRLPAADASLPEDLSHGLLGAMLHGPK